MNWKTKLINVIAALACGACTTTSGVLPIGPDTYQLSAASGGYSGPQNAQREALTEANGFCSKLGKDIQVVNTSRGSRGARVDYELTFRCLSKGDPELKRPDLRAVPNVIIEDRR